MTCLFAVTTDLPASSARRIHSSAGVRPPISSTITSTSSVRTSDEVVGPADRRRDPVDPLARDIAIADCHQLELTRLQVEHQPRHGLADGSESHDGDTTRPLSGARFQNRHLLSTSNYPCRRYARGTSSLLFADVAHAGAEQKKPAGVSAGSGALTFSELLRCDRADPAASVDSHRANPTGDRGHRRNRAHVCRGV